MFLRTNSGRSIDFIIAGLGNPGRKYETTRHNSGFMALDALAKEYNIRVDRLKWNALVGDGMIGEKRVLLIKPQTYMNCSGEAVTAAMRFYKLPPERVLVLHDDISLEPGVMRIRRKGSDGGQKGLRSIIEMAGADTFPRIKLGVGAKPHPDYELADWVLSSFSPAEREKLDTAIENAVKAIPLIVEGRVEEAMNKYSK